MDIRPTASALSTGRKSSRVPTIKVKAYPSYLPAQHRNGPERGGTTRTFATPGDKPDLGPGGFFRKLFTGELGVLTGGPSGGAPWRGDESKECQMLREFVLKETVLSPKKLLLKYDAKTDGWNANAFHQKCDNQGPCFIIAKTKTGGYFGGFNPIGVASREDYRDCLGAFLVRWPKKNSTKEVPIFLPKTNGGGPAIYDFGAEGPIFGASALKIPLGNAPSMGSSYAQLSSPSLFGGGKEIKIAKSRLGTFLKGKSLIFLSRKIILLAF